MPSQEQAAILVQKNFRGFLVRQKYALNLHNLKKSQRSLDLTFVTGNDPEIEGLTNYKPIKPTMIGLVATSGMRAIQIACELGYKELPPKLFIIDHSHNVYLFWQAVWQYTRRHTSEAAFRENLDKFLELIKNCNGDETTQDMQRAYFLYLIKRFGFDYVRAVILKVTCVCQSWEDEKLFEKVKWLLNLNNIKINFVYASNIIACVKDVLVQTKILNNIAKFQPVLSIHTDLGKEGFPENVYLCENQNPDDILQKVLSDVDSGNDQNDELLNSDISSDEEYFASLRNKVLNNSNEQEDDVADDSSVGCKRKIEMSSESSAPSKTLKLAK